MTYQEFLDGTNARKNDPRTIKQYKIIEQIRSASGLSNYYAFAIWHGVFGAVMRAEEKLASEDGRAILHEAVDGLHTAHSPKCRDLCAKIVEKCYLRMKSNHGEPKYTDAAGYTWVIRPYPMPYGGRGWKLYYRDEDIGLFDCDYSMPEYELRNPDSSAAYAAQCTRHYLPVND